MAATMSDECECVRLEDLVELVVAPAIWGMAIGFEGSLVHVRLPDGSRAIYHKYELRKMAGRDGPLPGKEEDNVINFTKAGAA